MTWKTDALAVLTYISSDGAKQIITEIDLNEPVSNNQVTETAVNSSSGQFTRLGQHIQVNQVATPQEAINGGIQNNQVALNELKVYVTQCGGLPVDAEQVTVIMYKDPNSLSLKRIGEYTGKRISRGIYSVVMPSAQATKIDVSKVEICEALKAVATNVACSNVSKVLRKIVKTGGKVSLPSIILTEIADRMVEEVCSIMADQTSENACSANFDDTPINLYTGDVAFLATVVPATGGAIKYLPMVIVDGKNTSYPNLKAELGGESKINALVLNPDRPLAKQPYTATASIACLPINTIVSISVVGTDGYKDTQNLVVNKLDTNGNFTISLGVPGAVSGIKDDINLTATLPDGKKITRSASLISQ